MTDSTALDNTVFVGALLPLGGTDFATPEALSYVLALNEIQAGGGLPGGTGSPRRSLAAVICDSNPGVVAAGLNHLVALQVPAVAALFSQTEAAAFVQDTLVPNGIFTMNPNDAPDALLRIATNQLIWHLLGPPEDIAPAYRPMLKQTETYARSLFNVPSAPLRIAVVYTAYPSDSAMYDFITNPTSGTGVLFNGVNLSENGSSYLALSVPSLDANPSATFGDSVQTLASFRPQVVIAVTGGETEEIIPPLEAALAAQGGGAVNLPVYVLGPRNVPQGRLLTYLGNSDTQYSSAKTARFLGIQYAGATDRTQYNAWFGRMKDAYSQVPDSGGYIDPNIYKDAENYYDAIYWLAYGLFAAGPGAPLTGRSFAAGVRNLLSGPVVNPGPGSLVAAFGAISLAGSARFVGALGTPEINTATGAWNSVGSVYCFDPVSPSGVRINFEQLRYNPANGQLEGNFTCFLGF